MVAFMPRLVQVYGDVAAAAAAEWYESVRAREVGGVYNAVAAAGIGDVAPQKGARYAAGHLFTENPNQTLTVLSGAVQRYVLHSSRETIAGNVARDRARPKLARVPTGAKTCAFCSMMASRGFVYRTRDTAGAFSDWHDDCDCQIVSEWGAGDQIAGYDPDRLYGMYSSARDAVGGDPNEILAEMRRMFPDEFTDGVIAE